MREAVYHEWLDKRVCFDFIQISVVISIFIECINDTGQSFAFKYLKDTIQAAT